MDNTERADALGNSGNFQEYCRKLLKTNPEIVEMWEKSKDPFDRALGKTVKAAAEAVD